MYAYFPLIVRYFECLFSFYISLKSTLWIFIDGQIPFSLIFNLQYLPFLRQFVDGRLSRLLDLFPKRLE